MGFAKKIISEIDHVLGKVEEDQLRILAEKLCKGKRIFVVGEGRSGLIGKSFAMRLMHLGANVFVVGETITPALEKEDILVAVSGSGQTKSVVETAAKARKLGCEVLVLTANPDSDLSASGTLVLHIPAATKYRKPEEPETIQPLGSLFDQTLHVAVDIICLYFGELKNEDNSSAFNRHSNLE